MEMHGLSKPSISALSTPSIPPASPLSQLTIGLTKLTDDIVSLQKQAVSLSSRSQPKPSTPHIQSSHSARSKTAATCWHHTTFGVKACRCICLCCFTSKQRKRDKQAANTSQISTFGICSLALDIGLRRLFHWVFVVADIPCTILGADFLAAFDLLMDCRQSRLHEKITNLTVKDISSSDAPCQLTVLDPEPENRFWQLLAEYPDLTRPKFNDSLPPQDVVHNIRTTGPLVFSRPRHLAPTCLVAAKAEHEHILQMNIICQSESPWASPLHMVPKAATDDWRPCGDYSAQNNITVPDSYPAPRLQDFAGTLFGKCVFSNIDLVRAFHQIPIAPEDVSKTAVTTTFGLFDCLRMPFGLHNASQTFQRFVDRVLRGLPFVYVYIDDLLVASSTAEEHMEHLASVFDRLQQFGVVLNPSKCVFCVPSLEFLGHLVDSNGIHPLPSKLAAIRVFLPPLPNVSCSDF
ncbi:hypothetical protein SprV_0602169700 [Sparganum proliferum]